MLDSDQVLQKTRAWLSSKCWTEAQTENCPNTERGPTYMCIYALNHVRPEVSRRESKKKRSKAFFAVPVPLTEFALPCLLHQATSSHFTSLYPVDTRLLPRSAVEVAAWSPCFHSHRQKSYKKLECVSPVDLQE